METQSEVGATTGAVEKKRRLHWPSALGGFLIGCLVGCVANTPSSNTTSGNTVASAQRQAATQAPAQPAPPAADTLPIKVGRGREDYGWTEFPVSVENKTGGTASYIAVNCSFYSKGGDLVGTALENWTNVPAGATAGGTVRTQEARLSEIDNYKCFSHGN